MALTKITTNAITDQAVEKDKIKADAIDATRIADDAVSEEHLDVTAITGNTELSAARDDNDVLLVFDTSSGTIKKIQASNLGVLNPTISSVSPTNVNTGDGTGNHTFVITGTKFSTGVTAKLVNTSGSDVAFSSVTRNSATQLTCVIAKSTLVDAGEPYDVSVTSSGITATLTDQINVNAQPVFTTAAGSLGSVTESVAGIFKVNATDPESAGNVTFELQSGSIPTGMTLSNQGTEGGTAVISGTPSAVSATTTFNFVLRAVDAASNTSSRAFSITVNNQPVSTSFTSSGTFSVPSGVTSIDVLVVAGGGGGGGGRSASPAGTYYGGGGGGGGLIFFPAYPVTPGGTIAVTVGCGGSSGPSGNKGQSGQDSVFGASPSPGLHPSGEALTAKGGGGAGAGYGLSAPSIVQALQGGSGGGSGSDGGSAGQATQPSQPGDSGAYGFGSAGGRGINPSGGKGGGGGGAGGSGSNSPNGQPGGAGGAGKAYTIGDGSTPVTYAAGGQGGGNSPGQNAPANTGNGGHGTNDSGGGYNASKGIVIVRA